jgi:hypothetical protein
MRSSLHRSKEFLCGRCKRKLINDGKKIFLEGTVTF